MKKGKDSEIDYNKQNIDHNKQSLFATCSNGRNSLSLIPNLILSLSMILGILSDIIRDHIKRSLLHNEWGYTKQWPLAGEFVEFEYSPKWSFWKIGRTRYIRQHSPTCFGWTRYIRRHSPNHFARTRWTRERQVWRLLHEFSEFGKFSECRLDRFIHIKYVICA